MIEGISNNILLSQVYAGAVESVVITTWDAAREHKRVEHQKNLAAWGQELKDSRVGQLMLACNGLMSGRGSTQSQGEDGFMIQPSNSNVLSLHYVYPPATRWRGEFITADLSESEWGQKVWTLNVLSGIYKEPQIIGGIEFGTKEVGAYERIECLNEEGAYQFLEEYIQTSACAQTLREYIGINLELAEVARKDAIRKEAERKAAEAAAAAPTPAGQ